MLDDEIRGCNLLDDLHYEDCVIITEAQSILKSAPIGNFIKGDGSDKVWFDNNVNVQIKLMGLKSRIDYLTSKYQLTIYKKEGECLQSQEYEWVKSRDERIARMYNNEPELVDTKLTLDKLKILSRYIDGFVWSLKDLMKLFK